MTNTTAAARIRGVAFRLRASRGVSSALITELDDIATDLERSRTMTERIRQAIYGLIISTERGASGNYYIRDSWTYSWAMSELHAIIDEIAPQASGAG